MEIDHILDIARLEQQIFDMVKQNKLFCIKMNNYLLMDGLNGVANIYHHQALDKYFESKKDILLTYIKNTKDEKLIKEHKLTIKEIKKYVEFKKTTKIKWDQSQINF